ARVFFAPLLHKTLGLLFGVIELRKAIGQLPPANKKFETISHRRVVIVTSRQRRNLNGIFGSECGLISCVIDRRLKYSNLNFAEPVAVFDLDSQIFSGLSRALQST